ncbi:MAG: hypothetical protein ACKVOW_05435 [Chitinophagaceae bacterium]
MANKRFIKISGLLFLLLIILSVKISAQKITYTEPERDDTRRTNFEIIGKVGANYLIFKNNRSNNDISVYDNNMKLLDRVKQTDLDDRWINVDFVAYPDFTWMVYQYQRKSIVYCMAVKIDPNGKRITEPVELDTTRIGWAADNKIYTTLFSDDKSKILVFKVNSKNQDNFVFTTLLFNSKLELQYKHRMNMAMRERNDDFTDFFVDNDGDFVFGKYIRKGYGESISDVYMVTKKNNEESFSIRDIKAGDRMLDEIKLKVDNNNKRYIFSALYYRQRRGNVEGLYTVIWDKIQDSISRKSILPFDEEIRKLAKGPDANLKMAFDDYFITNVITRKDGGYLLISESMYSSSRGNNFNRWDYRYNTSPWSSPIDNYYWSPYSSYYYSPWSNSSNRFGGSSQNTRYHSENIMVISFDKDGNLEWQNGIPKVQYDDDNDGLISHQVLIAGGEIQFLFNLLERRTLILNNQSISPDGKISRHPTLKNLDREIDFMPRFGKQVSARALIVPCMNRNNLSFAKIEF